MREFLGLRVSFWWHLGRISVGLYLITKLASVVTDNGWIQSALVLPLVWMLTMVSNWRLSRADAKAHNLEAPWCDRVECYPWNWRVLVSPGHYFEWLRYIRAREALVQQRNLQR